MKPLMLLWFLLQMTKMNPGNFCCAFILCLLVAFTFTIPVAKKEEDFRDPLPAESKTENDAAVEPLFQKRSSICCSSCRRHNVYHSECDRPCDRRC